MTDDKKRKPEKIRKKTGSKWWIWPICAFFITLVLSAAFTLASASIISKNQIWVIIVVLVVLLVVSIIFDMVGVAVAACDPTPFYSKASRKVRGAKISLNLLKNADRVSSICNDIIGDICGIVSGVCGAALSLSLIGKDSDISQIHQFSFWVPILVSSVISALTVGGKAFCKRLALKCSHAIVSVIGKFFALFARKG